MCSYLIKKSGRPDGYNDGCELFIWLAGVLTRGGGGEGEGGMSERILDAARRHSAGQESRSIPCSALPCAISLIRRYWAARGDPTTKSPATLPTSTVSTSPLTRNYLLN